jgi:hypothetical protein
MKEFKDIEIKVNSKTVDLNPFTRSIIGNTIEAMILSLRVEEGSEVVEITLTK